MVPCWRIHVFVFAKRLHNPALHTVAPHGVPTQAAHTCMACRHNHHCRGSYIIHRKLPSFLIAKVTRRYGAWLPNPFYILDSSNTHNTQGKHTDQSVLLRGWGPCCLHEKLGGVAMQGGATWGDTGRLHSPLCGMCCTEHHHNTIIQGLLQQISQTTCTHHLYEITPCGQGLNWTAVTVFSSYLCRLNLRILFAVFTNSHHLSVTWRPHDKQNVVQMTSWLSDQMALGVGAGLHQHQANHNLYTWKFNIQHQQHLLGVLPGP